MKINSKPHILSRNILNVKIMKNYAFLYISNTVSNTLTKVASLSKMFVLILYVSAKACDCLATKVKRLGGQTKIEYSSYYFLCIFKYIKRYFKAKY